MHFFSIKRAPTIFSDVVGGLIMVGFGLLFLALFMKSMSTTSLWIDEIYSITHFSSQGAFETITDYRQPNNHIFFNLLNALTPGSNSYHPLRARIWSFIFVSATLALGIYWLFRRGLFLEGGLFCLALGLNKQLLDLILQARGYGFLAFCALAICVLLLDFLRNPRTWRIVLLSLLTVLGTWTVPTFVFFSGSLLVLLFLWTKEKKVLVSGFIALVMLVVVYFPVYKQMLHHMHTYPDKWGRQYEHVTSVFRTIRTYLLNPAIFGGDLTKDWAIFAFLMGLVIIPGFIWAKNDSIGQEVILLLVSSMLFFVMCLKMESPLIRTTNFVVIPLTICSLLIFSRIARNPALNLIRPVLFAGIVTYFSWVGIHQLRNFSFTPIENWMGVAQHIARTYPEGMEVFATFRSHLLKSYLDKNYPINGEYDIQRFISGEQIVVDSEFGAKERFSPEKISPACTEVRIPQRRGKFQKVCVCAPQDPLIERVVDAQSVTLGEYKYDRDIRTPWSTDKPRSELNEQETFRIFLKPGIQYRSLYLVSSNRDMPVIRNIFLGINGKPVTLAEGAVSIYGDVMIVALGDQEVQYIAFKVPPAEKDRFLSVKEIWAYPVKFIN